MPRSLLMAHARRGRGRKGLSLASRLDCIFRSRDLRCASSRDVFDSLGERRANSWDHADDPRCMPFWDSRASQCGRGVEGRLSARSARVRHLSAKPQPRALTVYSASVLYSPPLRKLDAQPSPHSPPTTSAALPHLTAVNVAPHGWLLRSESSRARRLYSVSRGHSTTGERRLRFCAFALLRQLIVAVEPAPDSCSV
jgi:hypothetical protein